MSSGADDARAEDVLDPRRSRCTHRIADEASRDRAHRAGDNRSSHSPHGAISKTFLGLGSGWSQSQTEHDDCRSPQ